MIDGGGKAALSLAYIVEIEEISRLAGPLFESFRHSGVAMIVTDARQQDDPIVFVNDAFLDLSGYEAAELIGRNCRLMQAPGADPATVARIAAAIAAGRAVEAELLNMRKDGTEFWNRMLITPISGENGKPAYFLALQTDTTPAHRATAQERERRIRQDRLQRVNESLQHMLTISGAVATCVIEPSEGR